MKKILIAVPLLLCGLLLSSTARAALIDNVSWMTGTFTGGEVRLRAVSRDTGNAITPNSSSEYYAAEGLCLSCSSPDQARWDYQVSIILTNASSLDLTNVSAELLIDTDPSAAGVSWSTISVFGSWNTATFWNGTSSRTGASPVGGDYEMFLSVNPLDQNSGFGYLPSNDAEHAFQLNLYDVRETGRLFLASTGMIVETGEVIQPPPPTETVPEPASFMLTLFAIGLSTVTTHHRKTIPKPTSFAPAVLA